MAIRLAHDDDDFAETHEINVTPFIDVILVLLIIFMIAAPLATVDIPVDLPSGKGNRAVFTTMSVLELPITRTRFTLIILSGQYRVFHTFVKIPEDCRLVKIFPNGNGPGIVRPFNPTVSYQHWGRNYFLFRPVRIFKDSYCYHVKQCPGRRVAMIINMVE
jgi:hypothetical protein